MNSVPCFPQLDSDRLLSTLCIFDDLSRILFSSQSAGRPNSLSIAEIATISLIRAQYRIATLKDLYRLLAQKYATEFHLPAYKNFVTSMNRYAPHLLMMIHFLVQAYQKNTGMIKIVDSTPLPVCHNMRINGHKVMKSLATRSKSTMGWFYGLKLHLLIDLKNHMICVKFTTANVGDRTVLTSWLTDLYNSIIIADKGYVSAKLEKKAHKNNNILLTSVKKNMKKLATPLHIALLNVRIRIESIFSVLKTRCGLVTSLPRSVRGYLSHYIRTIFAHLFRSLLIS